MGVNPGVKSTRPLIAALIPLALDRFGEARQCRFVARFVTVYWGISGSGIPFRLPTQVVKGS